MIKVAIGSTNPTKFEATLKGFRKVWPKEKFEFIATEVSSGISDQPMSDQESIQGAINRAKKAIKDTGADFGVGLEGGLQQVGKYWFECGWIAVVSKAGEVGIGCSPKLLVPKRGMDLIKKGHELGEVSDILFGTKNSKHKQGYFGLMTKGVITRAAGYRQGVIMALVRFLNPKLFN
jgi:inosine/xanthosine triphosphatase